MVRYISVDITFQTFTFSSIHLFEESGSVGTIFSSSLEIHHDYYSNVIFNANEPSSYYRQLSQSTLEIKLFELLFENATLLWSSMAEINRKLLVTWGYKCSQYLCGVRMRVQLLTELPVDRHFV